MGRPPGRAEPCSWKTTSIATNPCPKRKWHVTKAKVASMAIAHPTKRMITLAVNKSVWVDDLKVWKLK